LHTVTLPSAIAASSSYSSGSIGNTTSYRYYRVNVSLTGGGSPAIAELELYQPGTAALASGGSFNFNTAGVTVSATSTSASLSAGATNLITVTATTGTVTLSLGSAVIGFPSNSTQIISYTGNCNFTLNGVRFTGGSASTTNAFCINKSSTGTITITGDLVGGSGATTPHALNSTAGNTVVIGSVFASGTAFGISQSAGNVTVTGNVTGGTGGSIHGISLTGAASQFTINGDVRGGSLASAHGINFGGTLGTVNGNVTGGGGSGARGISTDTGGVNVTGNVIGNVGIGLVIGANSTIIGNIFGGGASAGINTAVNNSFTVTVTGDVYASTTQAGIQLTGTGTQVVNLTGNMYNTLGRMAIWCPNVFISNTATTLWRMDTGGGNYKFLYSADSTPNLPATTNVRNGVTFGPALSLTGTMVTVSAANTRKDVPTDNTVGTGELTSADIISGINASSDDLAVRLKNTLTDTTAGNIISQYNNS
jgi:fibronectin-binding autotransporter adhesin